MSPVRRYPAPRVEVRGETARRGCLTTFQIPYKLRTISKLPRLLWWFYVLWKDCRFPAPSL